MGTPYGMVGCPETFPETRTRPHPHTGTRCFAHVMAAAAYRVLVLFRQLLVSVCVNLSFGEHLLKAAGDHTEK